MTDQTFKLLAKYAALKLADEKEWEAVFGPNGNRNNKTAYSEFRKVNEVAQQAVLAELKNIAYPVQNYFITGQAPNGVDHYTIDNTIKSEFGDHVIVDSEHSQIFIYVTEEKHEEVATRVRELVGEGIVRLNNGEEYPAHVDVEQDDDLQIAAIGSWSSARRWVEQNAEKIAAHI